jgi:hypothetical protein
VVSATSHITVIRTEHFADIFKPRNSRALPLESRIGPAIKQRLGILDTAGEGLRINGCRRYSLRTPAVGSKSARHWGPKKENRLALLSRRGDHGWTLREVVSDVQARGVRRLIFRGRAIELVDDQGFHWLPPPFELKAELFLDRVHHGGPGAAVIRFAGGNPFEFEIVYAL